MKKRIYTILLSVIVMVNTFTFVGYADSGISVTLNGEKLSFDVPPQLIDNRTMVPLRIIFEAMGADVDWNNDTQTVTATKGDERVIATINSKNVYISGETKELDVPPLVIDGRTLVPIRFVAEAFGANVNWDEGTRTVIINIKWDGVGEVPCYDDYPQVPDFGKIFGIQKIEYKKGAYSYIIKDTSNLSLYINILENFGFEVSIWDSSSFSGIKDGIYVDGAFWKKNNTFDLCITQ